MIVSIILQLSAIIVIILEIIIPSGGLLSIVALLLFGYSINMIITTFSFNTGMIVILADFVLVPIVVIIGLKLLAKSPVTLKKTLSREEGCDTQLSGIKQYLGQDAIAITDLRPSGMAKIGDKRLNVLTNGEYIQKDSLLTIYAIQGNTIFVQKKDMAINDI